MMESTHRDMAVRGLIRVLIGVGTGAGVMAVAIAWRVSHRPETPALLPILGWQLLVWLPWVAYYYVVRHLVRRLGTYQDATMIGLSLHVLSALLIALSHLIWFWQVSSLASPFLELPGTRYGAYAFFFVFWFLIDLLLYCAVLASVGLAGTIGLLPKRSDHGGRSDARTPALAERRRHQSSAHEYLSVRHLLAHSQGNTPRVRTVSTGAGK